MNEQSYTSVINPTDRDMIILRQMASRWNPEEAGTRASIFPSSDVV